jgi:hypothetical protein
MVIYVTHFFYRQLGTFLNPHWELFSLGPVDAPKRFACREKAPLNLMVFHQINLSFRDAAFCDTLHEDRLYLCFLLVIFVRDVGKGFALNMRHTAKQENSMNCQTFETSRQTAPTQEKTVGLAVGTTFFYHWLSLIVLMAIVILYPERPAWGDQSGPCFGSLDVQVECEYDSARVSS